MRLTAGVVALIVSVAGLGVAASTEAPSPHPRPIVLALRGGGFHLGGGGLFSRSRYGSYGRYGSRHPILHHVARALFYTWLLHLFFSSGAGSILLWIIIIALVAHLFRRRRRRQYSY